MQNPAAPAAARQSRNLNGINMLPFCKMLSPRPPAKSRISNEGEVAVGVSKVNV